MHRELWNSITEKYAYGSQKKTRALAMNSRIMYSKGKTPAWLKLVKRFWTKRQGFRRTACTTCVSRQVVTGEDMSHQTCKQQAAGGSQCWV